MVRRVGRGDGLMLVEIGLGRFAHPSGALWLPEHRALLIADAHLGYGWAQRRRGELGALRDEDAVDRIYDVVDELAPATVVFVGDLVHAPRPSDEERALIESTLARVTASAEVVIVRGNHDRGFEADFGRELEDEWMAGSLIAVHGHELRARRGKHVIAGHWHPAFRIRDSAGVTRKLPAFYASARLTVLPAFTPFAGGINLAAGVPEGLTRFSGAGAPRIFATTGRSVMRLR